MLAIIDNCLSKEECDNYIKRIKKWHDFCIYTKKNPMQWRSRVIDITAEEITLTVKNILESKINVNIGGVDNAEIQCWPVDSYSIPHIHDSQGREPTDFNSLLYLNDDFEGGEFFTENGIMIKPIPGRLTFFDGSKIKHGLNKVLNTNRYTLIFWWKNTKFK